jgi:hypothetical protein
MQGSESGTVIRAKWPRHASQQSMLDEVGACLAEKAGEPAGSDCVASLLEHVSRRRRQQALSHALRNTRRNRDTSTRLLDRLAELDRIAQRDADPKILVEVAALFGAIGAAAMMGGTAARRARQLERNGQGLR